MMYLPLVMHHIERTPLPQPMYPTALEMHYKKYPIVLMYPTALQMTSKMHLKYPLVPLEMYTTILTSRMTQEMPPSLSPASMLTQEMQRPVKGPLITHYSPSL